MKISSRQLAYIVLLDLIFVSIWGISMVLDMITAGSVETIDQAFNYVTNPSIFYYMSYINAVLLTCVGTIMFVGLYLYYQSKENSILNVIGLIFIPIYALLNIFAYGSQITIIPVLIPYLEIVEYQNVAKFTIMMFVQNYPGGTIISIINLCAYGILGIPTVIFAKNLIEETVTLKKVSGILLGLSGLFCFVSVGSIIILAYNIAGITSIIGGFLTLVAEIPLVISLFKE